MRIVLDSNVLIAAYISRGLCSEILEVCLKKHEIIFSDPLWGEIDKKLVHKFHQPAAEVKEYLNILSLHGGKVQPRDLGRSVSRDPKDDVILATALSGKAAYLVSGDKDLLVLKSFRQIRIVSPRAFWEKVVVPEGDNG